jgi:hypothetical protein
MEQHSSSAAWQLHTNPELDIEIREKTINELRSVQDANLDVVNQRLHMLNGEWDMERVLEAGASAFTVAGTILGFARGEKWFLLSGAAGGLLLMRVMKGRCLPVSLIRRLGVRTGSEIANERIVLKMMRKDFEYLPQDVREMLRIAEQ